jgi:hypothetical protein
MKSIFQIHISFQPSLLAIVDADFAEKRKTSRPAIRTILLAFMLSSRVCLLGQHVHEHLSSVSFAFPNIALFAKVETSFQMPLLKKDNRACRWYLLVMLQIDPEAQVKHILRTASRLLHRSYAVQTYERAVLITTSCDCQYY